MGGRLSRAPIGVVASGLGLVVATLMPWLSGDSGSYSGVDLARENGIFWLALLLGIGIVAAGVALIFDRTSVIIRLWILAAFVAAVLLPVWALAGGTARAALPDDSTLAAAVGALVYALAGIAGAAVTGAWLGADRTQVRSELSRDFPSRHRSTMVIVGMALVTSLLPFVVLLPPMSGFLTQTSWVDNFATAGVFVLLALGLNVVVGMAGLLDLGYAAFFAIGSYSYAYGASVFTQLHIPFWLMLPIGAVVAAVFGILLGAPTLRLRGDYLAIVTLGFGEIVPVVFKNASQWTKGTDGIGGLDRPGLPGVVFGATNPLPYYLTMAVVITIVLILLYRLEDSRLGRAWQAIREDELAASSNGINTVTTKLLAFAMGATTAGFAGVFNASRLVFVHPDQFLFYVSFTVLAMVVLGGMGNLWGVAIGAFVIYIIQSVVLKQANVFFDDLGVPILKDIDFLQYQFLLYGIALVGMMLLRPEGLFPSRARARELHTAELEGADVEGPDPGGPLARGAES
jgi:ABC-type branched-subunit amino acid transport system permease subunit